MYCRMIMIGQKSDFNHKSPQIINANNNIMVIKISGYFSNIYIYISVEDVEDVWIVLKKNKIYI